MIASTSVRFARRITTDGVSDHDAASLSKSPDEFVGAEIVARLSIPPRSGRFREGGPVRRDSNPQDLAITTFMYSAPGSRGHVKRDATISGRFVGFSRSFRDGDRGAPRGVSVRYGRVRVQCRGVTLLAFNAREPATLNPVDFWVGYQTAAKIPRMEASGPADARVSRPSEGAEWIKAREKPEE